MILVTGATGKNCALEFVEADFDDTASLRKAQNGVERAFLVTKFI